MQIGEIALIVVPPIRLGRRGKAGDEADRHFLASSVDDGLIHRAGICLAHGVEDARQQLEIGVILQNGVGDRHVTGEHIAVHFELREVERDLVDVGKHFRPDGLGTSADDVLAGIPADGLAVNIRPQLGILIGQIAEDLHELGRNAEFCAGRAVLLSAELAEALKKFFRAVLRKQGVALLIGKAEPAALRVVDRHGMITPFGVGGSGRLCRRGIRCGRRLRFFQTADFFVDLVDLFLHTGDVRGVRAALLLKSIHSGLNDAALLIGLRLGDVMLQLRFAGREAIARGFERLKLSLQRCKTAPQQQNF